MQRSNHDPSARARRLASGAAALALAAAAESPYTQAAFDQALAAGQPVIVDFARLVVSRPARRKSRSSTRS